MADDLTTILRFVGDAASAEASINALITKLQQAATLSGNLFSGSSAGGKQAATNINAVTAATDKLAASAAKAEAAMFRQAQIQARIQQVSGDSTGAIKTLGDALAKASDPKSLPALRTELQKTYLDTNYANSPLISAIRQINGGLGFLRPILGSTAGDLQKIVSVGSSVAGVFTNTGEKAAQSAVSANSFFETIKKANAAIVAFGKDQGGSASATDFFLNLSKVAAEAGDRIRAAFAGIRDSLANALGRSGGVQTLGFGNAASEAGTVTKALSSLTPAAEGASASLAATGASSTALVVGMGAVVVAIGAVVVAVAGLIAVASAAASALFSIGEAGVKTNSELEQTKIGIATVLASVGELRNAGGVKLEGVEALNAALPIASDQVRKLRIEALQTTATFEQIAPAFQAGIGAGLQSGLNLDQIREKTIQITQALAAFKLPLEQAQQETRAILSGEINRNTQVAVNLDLSKKAADEAIKQGRYAELLDEKLKSIGASGKLLAETFAGASSNLKEASETFGGVVSEGLFKQLRDKLNQVLPQIFDTSKASLISDNFKGIADTLTRVFDTAGASINRVIDFAIEGIKSISVFLSQNQATIGEIIEEVNQVISLVAETVAGVFRIAAGAQDAGQEMNALAAFGKAVVVVVGLIGDGIKFWASSLFLVGNAIKLVIIAPLEVAVKLLAALLSGIPLAGAAADNAARALESSRKSATSGIVESSKNLASSIANVGQASAKSIAQIDEARKRAAAGQRAVSGLTTPTPAATGATFTGPKRAADKDKDGAAKARQEAAAELKLLQTIEKEAELADKRITNALRNALTDRLISLEAYTQASIDEETSLLQIRLNALDAEEKAAVRTAKNATDAEAKRAEFRLKRATAEQESDIKREELRDNLRRTQEKAEEDHQNRLNAIAEIGRRATDAQIKAAVQLGSITNEAAEIRLAAAEQQRFKEREASLIVELALKGKNKQEFERISDELVKLDAEQAAATEDAARRKIAARQQDVDDARRASEALAQLSEKIKQGEVDALNRTAGSLETRAQGNPALGDTARLARQRASFAEEQRLNEENNTKLRAAQVAAANDRTLDDQQKFDAIAANNVLIEQEELRHAQAVAQIQASVISPFQAIQGVLKQAAAGFFEMGIAALASGQSVGQAMRAMAAAVLKQIASIAAVEAVKNVAYGLNALGYTIFTADPRGAFAASHYFASAALWGTLAVGAALGSAAIGRGGGSAGGSVSAGGGSNTSPTRRDDPQTFRQDSINREQKPQIVIIRTEVGEGTVVRHLIQDVNNNGPSRQIIRREAGNE